MRYLPHAPHEIEEMLSVIGAGSEEELFASIPADHRSAPSEPSRGLPEFKLLGVMEAMAARNRVLPVKLAGAGVYFHAVPAAVSHIVSRSEFMTAYTPYQPEVSQGTLQAIFEFQTMVSELLGLEVANASLYDAATGLGEALLMAVRVHKNKRTKVLISRAIHPLYLKVVETMLGSFGGITVEYLEVCDTGATTLPEAIGGDVAAVALGYPNFYGVLEPLDQAAGLTTASGALLISVTQDAALLGTLAAPGALGVDIAVAEGMSLAGTMGMGGPSVGLMATRSALVKQMPGRIVGQTQDTGGERGYVLTLATREQHIRREKATSNICSNQALVALAFSVHIALLGHLGLERINTLSMNRARRLMDGLLTIPGVRRVFSGPFVSEFVLSFPGRVEELCNHMVDSGVLFGIRLAPLVSAPELADAVLLATVETLTEGDIDRVVELAANFYGGRK